MPFISVIVTTYNRPNALSLVLKALLKQDDRNFEILVADDGSSEETARLIHSIKEYELQPIHHVWQENNGFQVAKIRNKAIAKAKGEYICFLDGDTVPTTTYITRHKKFAKENFFVTGSRVLLSKQFTEKVIEGQNPLQEMRAKDWFLARVRKECNKTFPLLYIKGSHRIRTLFPNKWKGVRTCNLAAWRKDILKINGFDESFNGWGYEDSDFVLRLMKQNVKRKEGRLAIPVFHLWHPKNDRSKEVENKKKLMHTVESDDHWSTLGLDQYLIK